MSKLTTVTTGATIPPGLTELLEEFAITVLREHPTDLVSFAASYFTNLREENARNNSSSQKGSQRAGPAPNSEENQMESESMATDTPAPREMEENGTSAPLQHDDIFIDTCVHFPYLPFPSFCLFSL